MEVTIAIPFWGNHPAYRTWLDRWLEHYRTSGCTARPVIISDEVLPADLAPGVDRLQVSTAPFSDLVDPAYPYDRKGAIVCAAILALAGLPLFVLDADAWISRDPLPLLAPHANDTLALPEDEGAFRKPYAEPHASVIRRCAGVIYFAARSKAVRQELVSKYRTHYLELRAAIETGSFAEERRLLEQHAWTFVAHELNTRVLPRELNWPVCFRSSGENPLAAIHHHIGRKKWSGHGRPPSGILNNRQETLLAGGAA